MKVVIPLGGGFRWKRRLSKEATRGQKTCETRDGSCGKTSKIAFMSGFEKSAEEALYFYRGMEVSLSSETSLVFV